jgi:hypothetical protein
MEKADKVRVLGGDLLENLNSLIACLALLRVRKIDKHQEHRLSEELHYSDTFVV